MLATGLILLFVAAVVSLVGTVMFVAAAFRISLLWGLLVLFVPFAGLVFLIKYWPHAKRGFVIGLAGSAVAVVAFLMLSGATASKARVRLEDVASAKQVDTDRRAQPRVEGAGSAAPATSSAQSAGAPSDPAAALPTAGAEDAKAAALLAATVPKGLPQVPPDSDEPGKIRLPDLGKHVGEDLVFVEKSGSSVRGVLVTVSPHAVRIERGLAGGSVQYELARAGLREVRAAY